MNKQIAFFAAEPVEITGYAQECECSHCGRPLKIGVRLAGFGGVFGADCLAKSFASFRYNGRRCRYGADEIKQRGIVAGKGVECMKRNNMGPHHFRFVLKTPLYSI